MYITSKSQLHDVLDERKNRRNEIRARRDEFVQRKFGIPAYNSLIDRHFGTLIGERPAAILGRHIASITIEEIACFVGTLWMDLSPCVISFVRNGFTSNNKEKCSKVNVPWIRWSKKRNLVLRYERVTNEKPNWLNGVLLDQIDTLHGVPLVQLHQQWQQKVFGERYPVGDVSDFWQQCLQQATFSPPYRYIVDGKKERQVHGPVDGTINARPPAEWYYPLYLLWFVDGSMVQLENYDQENWEIANFFRKGMEEIKMKIGVDPLIVRIPQFDNEYHCNEHLLENPSLLDDLQGCEDHGDNIVVMFSNIVTSVLELGKPALPAVACA